MILQHRDDYISVLEYCDGIYEDLKEEDLPEEEKLRWAERPFSDFYTRVFLRACRENDRKLPEGLEEKGVAARWPKIDRSVYEDLSPEAIKASHPWDETLKEAIVSRGET